MKNCKNFKIYKFKYAYPKGDSEKSNQERWKRAEDMTNFKIKLIDNFCCLNFKELSNPFLKNPKKYSLISPFEIGLEILEKEENIQSHYYWDNLYIAVPLTKPNIIDFFDKNIPTWVTTVKRI